MTTTSLSNIGRSGGFFKAALVAVALSGLAETSQAKDLALRGIMADLGKNVGGIAQALAREDFAEVERLARAVADHPKVPITERARILTFLGRRMPEFKGHDDAVHATGETLVEAAVRKDAVTAIDAFANLQKACLACHENFRADIVNHFYTR